MATTLLTPAAVAQRAEISTPAVLKAIRERRLAARAVLGPDGTTSTWAITEREAERWLEGRARSAGQEVGAT